MNQTVRRSDSPLSRLLRACLALAFVIATLGGVAWLLARWWAPGVDLGATIAAITVFCNAGFLLAQVVAASSYLDTPRKPTALVALLLSAGLRLVPGLLVLLYLYIAFAGETRTLAGYALALVYLGGLLLEVPLSLWVCGLPSPMLRNSASGG